MKDSDKLHKHVAEEEQAEMDYLKNQQEAKANHYFTFGIGHGNRMFYVKIVGTYGSARERMFELFGKAWSFQYSEKQFNEHDMANHYTLHPISLTDEAIA